MRREGSDETVPMGADAEQRTLLDPASFLAGANPAAGSGSFGRYVGAEELARGGMGAIYRAIDPEIGRAVAIKAVLAGGLAGAEELGRFLREARITGQLQHPNIPPLHELARTPDGRIYFAMKLIDGRTLGSIVASLREEGPRALVRERTRLLSGLLKVCDALAYAHARGVIHRDLKPSNVMIGAFGEVLVMDWGIAKILGAPEEERINEARVEDVDPLRTTEGAVIGTPAYMSPEQADGRVGEIDVASDVYSLGAVIYEVLTGTPPYLETSLSAVIAAIVQGRREPPSRRAPGAEIPAELDRLVEKAMARDRAARYASVEELKRDLESFLADRPISAFRYTAWQRTRKWIRRNRAVSAVAGVSLSVILVALVLVAAAFLRASRERDDVLRLSERTPVDRLLEGDRLVGAWRGYPSEEGALERWLSEADAFLERLPYHERKLAEIRERGSPSGEAWAFDDPADQWQHEHREALVGRLRELEARRAEMALGLERARALTERLETEDREPWDAAVRSIGDAAECPMYGGLRLAPIAGLVPIGRDPASGLWEFWHVETGERPERGADRQLRMAAESGLVLVLVPGGIFRMGSEDGPFDDERPVHDVGVAAFLVSKYEMTQGQWRRATGENPSYFQGDELRPVEQVTWDECRLALAARGLRLPGEAEWEYAARGGTTGDRWTGDLSRAGNVADQAARARGASQVEPWDDGQAGACPVGLYLPNPFGLHDTYGNVWEWCEDAHHDDYAGAPADASPWTDGASFQRVARGGSYSDLGPSARSPSRWRFVESTRDDVLGVRPALDARSR